MKLIALMINDKFLEEPQEGGDDECALVEKVSAGCTIVGPSLMGIYESNVHAFNYFVTYVVNGDHHVCCVCVQPHVCTQCEGQFDLTLRAPTFVRSRFQVLRHARGEL